MSSALQPGPSEDADVAPTIDHKRSIIRVFVSSPGDVDLERKLTERVISRLQAKYASRGKIEPYFWEYEPMSNYETFQAQIPDCAKFDIVICILWSRLGIPLVAPDGKRYRSGTEYEVISSRAAWLAKARPDLMIYLNTAPAQIRQFPDAEFERSIEQLRTLKEFIAEYCCDPSTGENKGAYTTYSELGQFEQLIERHLDRLFDDKLPAGRAERAEKRDQSLVWGRRSPFRGLEAFDFEHAPIFFGRTKAIGEVVTRLRKRMAQVEDARASRSLGAEIEPAVFLLVSAMSGVGKSSLIRAGVLPLMVEPGNGVALWRRAMMRPSEATGDLFDGLARALCRPEGLPELVGGDVTVESIADLLRRNPAGIEFGLVTALDQAAATLRKAEQAEVGKVDGSGQNRGPASGPKVARLVLFIDQLEELFTLERVGVEERAGFVTALAAVARSGKAYVIGSLRSDFFGRCSELPLLAELSQGDGLYHLLPPSIAELGQMIRQPAAAAGLQFELHPDTKEALDDRLRDAAIRSPEALPLLQFSLEELYRAQERQGDGLLTHHDYEAMGGVEGSLARRAEELFLSLDPQAQAQFDHVMRRITAVVIEEAGAFNRRWAEYDELIKPAGAKAFVDAFLHPDARLFVIDRTDAGQVVVSVTHEALLTHWERLFRWLVDNRESLLTRAQVSADSRRWLESGKNADYLYRAGLPLVKAQKTLAEGFLDSKERDFVEASTMRAHAEFIRNRRVTQVVIGAISAALVLALVLAGLAFRQSRQAGMARARADQEAKRANLARAEAEKLINFMTTDLRDKLKPIGRLDLLADVNKRVEEYYGAFPVTDERAESQRQRSTALVNYGDVLFDQGAQAEALKLYNAALEIRRRLVHMDEKNLVFQADLALVLQQIGNVLEQSGNLASALENFKEARDIGEKLLTVSPRNLEWQRQLADSLGKVGHILQAQGDPPGALKNFREALDVLLKVKEPDSQSTRMRSEIWLLSIRVGEALVATKDLNSALTYYRRTLSIAEGLNAQEPKNTEWQRDVAVSYEQIGEVLETQGDLPEALESYKKSFDIRCSLFAFDPTNWLWEKNLALSYEDLGNILNTEGDLDGALKMYQESRSHRETLANRDETNADAQRDLEICVVEISSVLLARGELAEASEWCTGALKIARQLAEKDPSNEEWQSNVAEVSERVGDISKAQANFPEALKMYQNAMSIRRNLGAQDAKWQLDVAKNEEEIAAVLRAEKEYERALEFSRNAVKRDEVLFGQDQEDTDVQSNLATAYLELGETLVGEQKPDEALSNLRRSLEIFERLEKQYPNHATWESEIAFTRLQIADALRVTPGAADNDIRTNLMEARNTLLRKKQRFALGVLDEGCLDTVESLLRDIEGH